MQNLDSWLKDIIRDVERIILENRSYEKYFKDFIIQDEPFYEYRDIPEEPIADIDRHFKLYSSRHESKRVIPIRLFRECSCEWLELFHFNRIVDIAKWAKQVAQEENKIVFECLSKNAVEYNINVGNNFQLKEVIENVSNNWNANLIVNHYQIKNLNKFSMFKASYENGLAGQINHRNVYLNFGLPKDVGILIDSGSANLQISPLNIYFDSYSNPKILFVKEKIYSYSEDKMGIIKILFKEA